MTDNLDAAAGANLLDKLREARDKVAVLKLQLIQIKSDAPNKCIFVFEGDDDKIIYHAWIARSGIPVEYEAMICKGKRKVLELRQRLEASAENLIDGVYFFVDRDFDDLLEFDLGGRTFMTECYSVENVLVSSHVLEGILVNEFHLNGNPLKRAAIVTVFMDLLSSFLAISREANWRIFQARRLRIRLVGSLDQDCRRIAVISLLEVRPPSYHPSSWIVFEREPTLDEVPPLIEAFGSLAPAMRYRGKYIFDFMRRWIGFLAEDYRSNASVLFNNVDRTSRIRMNELGLGTFAMLSSMPTGLTEFLAAVRPPALSA